MRKQLTDADAGFASNGRNAGNLSAVHASCLRTATASVEHTLGIKTLLLAVSVVLPTSHEPRRPGTGQIS